MNRRFRRGSPLYISEDKDSVSLFNTPEQLLYIVYSMLHFSQCIYKYIPFSDPAVVVSNPGLLSS